MNVKILCGEAARPAGSSRLCFFVAVQLTPKALTLLAHHGFFLRGLTLELTGHRRQDGLARAGKMYRVPQPGPRQPAVGGPVVQRRVRPRPPDCARRVLVIVLTADRSRFSAQTEVGTLGFKPPRYRTTMYRCAGCGGPTN